MKKRLFSLTLFCMAGFLLFVFPGCYTQIAAERAEEAPEHEQYAPRNSHGEEGYAEQSDTNYVGDENPTVVNNYYGYGWHPGYGVGFSYYYPSYYWPSYAFAVAYNDPWLYDSYWAYDPWWCGTPYIHYPGYWGYPHYYGGGYYSPHNHQGGYADGRRSYSPRDFGSTRGSSRRGTTTSAGHNDTYSGRSGGVLPTGSVLDRNSGTNNRRSSPATVNSNSRQSGSQRMAPTRSSRSGESYGTTPRRSVSRNGGTRVSGQSGRNNSTPKYSPPAQRNSPPPARYSPPPASRGSGSVPSRGGSATPSGSGGSRSGGSHGGGRR